MTGKRAGKPQLIGAFYGVPDEMLKQIGIVVVLSARLDLTRMKILEAATSVPVRVSSTYRRPDLKKALKDAFANAPLDRLQDRMNAWHGQVDQLFNFRDNLVHSGGAYETRGDGTSRYVREHAREGERTQFSQSKLEAIIERLSDAESDGVGLHIETSVLVSQGPEAHDQMLAQHELYRQAVQRMHEEAAQTSG